MLPVGQPAPGFDAETLRGDLIQLSALRGRPVWLAFFRFAACPLCNYRVHQIIESWHMFEGRRFHMLAIFQSPPSRLRDFVAEQEPPFPLIADPAMNLYRLYALESSLVGAMTPNVIATSFRAISSGAKLGAPDGPATRLPGDYLIDGGGIIRHAYRGKDIADHIPLDMADRFLAAQGV